MPSRMANGTVRGTVRGTANGTSYEATNVIPNGVAVNGSSRSGRPPVGRVCLAPVTEEEETEEPTTAGDGSLSSALPLRDSYSLAPASSQGTSKQQVAVNAANAVAANAVADEPRNNISSLVRIPATVSKLLESELWGTVEMPQDKPSLGFLAVEKEQQLQPGADVGDALHPALRDPPSFAFSLPQRSDSTMWDAHALSSEQEDSPSGAFRSSLLPSMLEGLSLDDGFMLEDDALSTAASSAPAPTTAPSRATTNLVSSSVGSLSGGPAAMSFVGGGLRRPVDAANSAARKRAIARYWDRYREQVRDNDEKQETRLYLNASGHYRCKWANYGRFGARLLVSRQWLQQQLTTTWAETTPEVGTMILEKTAEEKAASAAALQLMVSDHRKRLEQELAGYEKRPNPNEQKLKMKSMYTNIVAGGGLSLLEWVPNKQDTRHQPDPSI